MPEFPRLVLRDGVEVVSIPDEKRPEVSGALPTYVPANDQTPSKLFSGKALAEFCRVWDSLNAETKDK